MEIELVTVKEETGPVIPSICPFCQEDLPTLSGPKGQVPQCQGCKSFVLAPQSWVPGNPEVLALSAERPYCCSFCPKRFKRASDRRDHERVHTGERPYGCGICGKRFTQSSVLSGHMRIHTGERPFCCGVCFKSFNNGSNFRKHQRIHSQLFSYSTKGDGERACDLLLGERQNQLAEGQNGCWTIKEVRDGESKRKQDSRGWEDNRISQNGSCSSGLRQHSNSAGCLKGIGLRQDNSRKMLQSSHECIGVRSLSQTGDGKRYVGCLGENGDCDHVSGVTENGHSFQPLKDVSGANHTKATGQNQAGGSHTQGEEKQPAESCNDKFQLDGSTCGKGLLLVDGNRAYAHKHRQESRVKGYLVRRPNGGYLKGVKHSNGEGMNANMRQNGTGGSHLSRLNTNRNISTLELRQNGSHGNAANDPRLKNHCQLGKLTQYDGTNKEKWMDFQVSSPEKINPVTPKVSSWTCPSESNVLDWEVPNIRIMKEQDEFEECSALDMPIDVSSWQLESPEPCSLPYNISISTRNHSQQFRSTSQHWEDGSSPLTFPFQDHETYEQHSLSALDSKPFLCFACPKQFRRATDLKEHLRVHTGERPFGCSVCGKRFTQSSALVTHRRLHTGEKPFECAVCYRRFNNSSNFAKHRRLHGQEGTRHSSKTVVKNLWSVKPH